MKFYWVTFVEHGLGCGVTAVDEADCRRLVEGSSFFEGRDIASVAEVRNVDELDQNHVVPNVGNIFMRGFWFPTGI